MFKYLVICNAVFWASSWEAQARHGPAPVVRLAIAIDAPDAQKAAIERQILPKTGEQMQLVGNRRYLAMADRLVLLWPYAPKSARRVGRALHATHVAVFRVTPSDDSGSASVVLRVTLVDVRSGRIPVHKRFVLADGTLSDAAAHQVIGALRYMLLGKNADAAAVDTLNQQISRQARSAAAPMPGSVDSPATQQSKNSADLTGASANQPAESISAAVGSRRTAHAERRLQMRLGLVVAMRKAQLSPQGAPCYCSENSFAPAIFGLRAASELFFDPNQTHFGARLEATLAAARLPIKDAVYPEESQSLPWSVQGDIAYRFFDSAKAAVIPHVGAAYARFPISRGPFVGTGYTTLYVGTLLETKPLAGLWVLHAGALFAVIAHSGLEAARLGSFQRGLGWQIQAGPTACIGPFRLGIEARYGALTSQYAGSTALFSNSRYVNVGLDDATLDVQVHLGGAPW